jgi:hypothetical protein
MNEPAMDVATTRSVHGGRLDRPAAEVRTGGRARLPIGHDDGTRYSSALWTEEIPRPRRGPAPRTSPLTLWHETGAPGGVVPSDDDLLERTLAFSGSYVSDDGSLTIRRAAPGSFEYSGSQFVGYCRRCARALLIPPDGEPLNDIRAAIRFAATHDHGDVD